MTPDDFVPPLQGLSVAGSFSQGVALGCLGAGPLALHRGVRDYGVFLGMAALAWLEAAGAKEKRRE